MSYFAKKIVKPVIGIDIDTLRAAGKHLESGNDEVMRAIGKMVLNVVDIAMVLDPEVWQGLCDGSLDQEKLNNR